MSDKQSITLADSLVSRVRALREKEGKAGLMLRVGVNGGGCQGFEYEFSFAESAESGDHLFEKDGVTVVIDEASLDLLAGSTLEYKEDLMGAFFNINNPNIKSSCGCGTSFSI